MLPGFYSSPICPLPQSLGVRWKQWWARDTALSLNPEVGWKTNHPHVKCLSLEGLVVNLEAASYSLYHPFLLPLGPRTPCLTTPLSNTSFPATRSKARLSRFESCTSYVDLTTHLNLDSVGVSWGWNELLHRKYLEQCPAHTFSQIFTFLLYFYYVHLLVSINLQVTGKNMPPQSSPLCAPVHTYTAVLRDTCSWWAGHFNGNKTGNTTNTNSLPLTSTLNLVGNILWVMLSLEKVTWPFAYSHSQVMKDSALNYEPAQHKPAWGWGEQGWAMSGGRVMWSYC